MRYDRAMSFVSFLDILSPFPLTDAKKYAALAAQRLEALDV
jgi:hypothetical protein